MFLYRRLGLPAHTSTAKISGPSMNTSMNSPSPIILKNPGLSVQVVPMFRKRPRARVAANDIATQAKLTKNFSAVCICWPLLAPQCFDWIKLAGADSWQCACEQADYHGATDNGSHVR